ncbi:MAG: trypsin-like peptidase domain-containing protein, partial [Gammaproteobacteria bacterium]|nr:trypsin-like peptidase domain-containing protein [Gammaproteobacteria bacterium]
MKNILVLAYLSAFFLCCIVTPTVQAQQSSNAQQLFAQLRDRVYQVRVIDIASGDKYSIGSGFQVSTNGLVATNFHVVSPYVHDQHKYRLELAHKDGRTTDIELQAIDVVSDLAILHSSKLGGAYLPLSQASLKQGDRIFSMGNP